MLHLSKPYLLFLGNAADRLAAKTAIGIAYWCPQDCVAQLRMPQCQIDPLDGIPELDLASAVAAGAKTLVIGVANRGGVVAPDWVPLLEEALALGLDIASGLHQSLSAIPALQQAAARHGRQLIDVRDGRPWQHVADGERRSGHRVLTVGTDCSVGKMYTSLALVHEMRQRGLEVDFRATGQTGILIAGSGVPVDAVIGDFISGAVEQLTPAVSDQHWDVVEGQGSLFHPSFSGVSLGLLHGSQPDFLVMCHEPDRAHMRGLPGRDLPSLADCIRTNEDAARLTNRNARCIGISLNTSSMSPEDATYCIQDISHRLHLPCVDPLRSSVAPIVDLLMEVEAS